ncbi:MAG: T9SS type A sorting domain-containing protein [Bacteroides sp.]
MKKITLLTAALLVVCGGFIQATGNLTLTKLWNKADYAWNKTNSSRDMDYYNGKLYVIDKTSKNIHVIDANDGSELPGEAIAHADINGYSVAADDAGNLFATNGGYGMTHCIKGGKIVSGVYTTLGNTTIPGSPGRFDFVELYGNIEGDNGGYMIASTTNTADKVAVWPMKNGAIVNAATPFMFNNLRGAFKTGADAAAVDANSFWLSGQILKPLIITMSKDKTTASKQELAISAIPNCGGIASFTLKGITYVVVPGSSLNGAVNIFDATNMAHPVLKETTEDIASVANGAIHVGIEATVKNDIAYIYVWSPNNGAAAYKFEDSTPTNISAETAEAPARVFANAEGIQAEFEGEANIELFSISGAMIDKATATGYYKANVDKGIYLVKINGVTYKVVK